MADEFFDLFNQLFYSTDVWGYLGVFGVLALFILLTKRVKEIAVIALPTLILMFVEYLQRSTANPDLIWKAIICLVGLVVVVFLFIDGMRNR